MRITEAKIRRIIKEELINVLEMQDPTFKYSFFPKSTPNIATNPEVRTKPETSSTQNISRTDIKFNPNEPIKSLEDLVINNPQFRNILVSSVKSAGFVDIPTISNFIKNYFALDQKRLDDVIEKVNSSGAINRLHRMALRKPAIRENKRK
jgi:hypothetical protein